MNGTTLIRLALAKTFLVKANNELRQGSDDLALATAAVDLHDCIDNFLGVLGSHYGLTPTKKDYLIDRFDAISDKYKESTSKPLPNRAEVELLNDIRNGVKHRGVLPNTSQVINLVKELDRFCNDVCKEVYGIRLDDVSLIAQVKNDEKRKVLESIEKHIEAKEYKEAMEESGMALFKYFDSHSWNLNPLSTISSLVRGKSRKDMTNVFPERDVHKTNLDLLEYGIDPYLYYRLGNLVPKVGYDNLEDRNTIVEYSSYSWHDRNWTAENAKFCLDFLTKLFIKQQRGYGGYTIVRKGVRHHATFNRDSATYTDLGKTVAQSFKKGETVSGLIDGYINGEFQGHREGDDKFAELTILEDDRYEKVFIPIADVSIATDEEYEKQNY